MSDYLAQGAGALANKAVNYGSKWLNHKANFGLNYAQNYIRQFDIFGILPERWTLLDESGEKAFEFDSFNKSSTKIETKVTQYPVEGGAFVSYNKVTSPMEINCVLIKQGYPEDLQEYVDALLEYAGGTDLLSIVTPEHEYQNMALEKVTFDRSAESGTDRIIAECTFKEVRQFDLEYTTEKVAKKQSRGRQQASVPESMLGKLIN